jgi:hypothetical protein
MKVVEDLAWATRSFVRSLARSLVVRSFVRLISDNYFSVGYGGTAPSRVAKHDAHTYVFSRCYHLSAMVCYYMSAAVDEQVLAMVYVEHYHRHRRAL